MSSAEWQKCTSNRIRTHILSTPRTLKFNFFLFCYLNSAYLIDWPDLNTPINPIDDEYCFNVKSLRTDSWTRLGCRKLTGLSKHLKLERWMSATHVLCSLVSYYIHYLLWGIDIHLDSLLKWFVFLVLDIYIYIHVPNDRKLPSNNHSGAADQHQTWALAERNWN